MKNVVQDLTSAGLDWDREKWRGSVASKFIRGGEKNAVKYADEIIVLSKDVQKYFLETYGRETHFIPNGVNRPEVREAKLITDHFGLEKDSYILFLGRLVPEKGIRYLVEAFKNVKTDKKLVIAGGSSDTDSFMEELKELAKGDDRILFTGFVQGAMLDELYSNAYIYTLPSDLEGMPLSLLEAMSYGNCCLVSDIPECTEVVEDKALIFKKSDVEDLREKLQDACDHPEMVMKMKNQAADFICEKYNWDEVVRETMKLYESMEIHVFSYAGDYKKASTCYLIGNVFNKGIAFLTVPIFTRILSTSDYGIVTTYNSWIGIVTMLLGFALHMAIRSSFIDYRAKVDEYSSFRYCWKQMVWRQEKTISLKDGMMPRKMQLSFRLKKMNKVPSCLKSVQLDITSIWSYNTSKWT